VQSKLVKNTIWNSIGVITYFACQWLITVIIVWLSDDYANRGNLQLAMDITNFFNMVALYNVRPFQISDTKGEYKDSEYVAARLITCAASILFCAVFVLIVDFSAMQRLIIICYMVFRANEAFIDVLHGIDIRKWRMDYLGISQVARGVSMLVAFVLLSLFFDLLQAIIGMAVITMAIGFLFDVPKAKKLAQFTNYANKQILSLLKRCFPLMLIILISTTIAFFSKNSIDRIYGTEALGIYASATAPALVIQVAITALFATLANLFTECLKMGDKKRFVKIFMIASAIFAGITLSAAVVTHFLGEWGLNILYGESLVPYAYILTGATIVSGLTGFMWFMGLVLTTVRDIKGILIGNLIGVVICLLITDVFLVRYGLVGANYIMIISQAATVICLLIRLFWRVKRDGISGVT